MPNNKSPGNDGFSNEFCENLSEEMAIPLCHRIAKSYRNRKLSTPHKQAVIKLIE